MRFTPSKAAITAVVMASTILTTVAAGPAASLVTRRDAAKPASRPDAVLRGVVASVPAAGTLLLPATAERMVGANVAAGSAIPSASIALTRAWSGTRGTLRPVAPAAPASSASGGYPAGSIRSLIVSVFTRIAGASQVATALCVAWRESRFDPYANNPSSSAAGLFQWTASSWSVYSSRYGFGGASVYDAYANTAVAANAVADGGWGPWGGGC